MKLMSIRREQLIEDYRTQSGYVAENLAQEPSPLVGKGSVSDFLGYTVCMNRSVNKQRPLRIGRAPQGVSPGSNAVH